MEKLQGQVAIITGGSQGIGKAIACDFADEGATVIILNRTVEKADAVVNEIRAAGGKAYAKPCDLAKLDKIKKLVDDIYQEFGRIDILVNNAGIFVNKSIDDSTMEDWQKTMDVNLASVFFLSQAIIPVMKKQGNGKIICISSVAAAKTFPNASIYCISKAGLAMLVKAFSLEYARYGISINSISPGNTATPINQHLQDNPEVVAWIKERTPTGRAYLHVSEVSKTAVFLASDDASAIHGSDIVVDDGWAIV